MSYTQNFSYAAVLFELSEILDCGLDRKMVGIILGLLRAGVHPNALASVYNELKVEKEVQIT